MVLKIFILLSSNILLFEPGLCQLTLVGSQAHSGSRVLIAGIPKLRDLFISFGRGDKPFIGFAQSIGYFLQHNGHANLQTIYMDVRKGVRFFYVSRYNEYYKYDKGNFNVTLYVVRFGSKYYSCMYDSQVADNSQCYDVTGTKPTPNPVHVSLDINDLDTRHIKIFGPFRIIFEKEKYEVGKVADAGIVLIFHSSGEHKIELFPIESLDKPFEEQNRLTVKDISETYPVDLNPDVHKNSNGFKSGISKVFDKKGSYHRLFDFNILVGDTSSTTSWVTLIESEPEYIYIEMSPFGVKLPSHRHCDYELGGNWKIQNRLASITLHLKTMKDNCNTDLKNVSINILPDMTVTGLSLKFDENSLILPYEKKGERLYVKGDITMHYKAKFTVSFKMPANRHQVEVFTDFIFTTMVNNEEKKVIESRVFVLKDKFDHKRKKDVADPIGVPEFSVAKFPGNVLIACQRVEGDDRSGCYWIYHKPSKVRYSGHMISVLGVDQLKLEVYGYSAKKHIIVMKENGSKYSLVSTETYKKQKKSKGFKEANTYTRKRLNEAVRNFGIYRATYYGIRHYPVGKYLFYWLPGDCAKHVAPKTLLRQIASCEEIRFFCPDAKPGEYWLMVKGVEYKIICNFEDLIYTGKAIVH